MMHSFLRKCERKYTSRHSSVLEARFIIIPQNCKTDKKRSLKIKTLSFVKSFEEYIGKGEPFKETTDIR